MQVFLSYSRRDAAFVGRLADDLAARGLDPWLDTDDLGADDEDRWRRSVVEGIRHSAVVIFVLSPDSVQSAAVERELTIAAEVGRRIVPIMHRTCDLTDGLMFDLAGVQRTDFVDQPYDVALDQLVRRVLAGHTVDPAETATPDVSDAPLDRAVGGRRWLVITAAGVVVVAGALVAFGLLQTDGGNDDDVLAGATTAADLAAETSGSEQAGTGSVEPPTASGGAQAAPTSTRPDEEGTQEVTTISHVPTSVTGETAALELIDELRQAYMDRAWDTVRFMNSNQADETDEDLAGGYASLNEHFFLPHDVEQLSATQWRIIGTVVAWDVLPERGERTNVACMEWTVDIDAGTVTQAGRPGAPGAGDHPLDGWIDKDQFDAAVAKYCPTS